MAILSLGFWIKPEVCTCHVLKTHSHKNVTSTQVILWEVTTSFCCHERQVPCSKLYSVGSAHTGSK